MRTSLKEATTEFAAKVPHLSRQAHCRAAVCALAALLVASFCCATARSQDDDGAGTIMILGGGTIGGNVPGWTNSFGGSVIRNISGGTLIIGNGDTGNLFTNRFLTITNGAIVFSNSVQFFTNNDVLILGGRLIGSNTVSVLTNGSVGLATNVTSGGLVIVGWSGVMTNIWTRGNGTLIGDNIGAGTLMLTNGILLNTNNNTFATIAVPTINIGGGILTNVNTGSSILNIQNGPLAINSGTVSVLQLVATNGGSGVLSFNGGMLTSLGSIISNGVRFVIGDGTNGATLNLSSGSHTFADGVVIAGNAMLTNTATLNTPNLVVNASGQFTMNGGLAVVNIVTNAGVFVQSGGLFDPAFYHNTGTLQITGGTNQDTVFLNDVGAIVQHSGGQHDVNIATNFGSWTVSGTATANLTNFISDGQATLTVIGGGILNGSLTIGNTGGMNQVMITNGGGVVAAGVGILGNAASSSSNVVIVTGNNSVWDNSGWLYVGRTGSFNQLTITNGGHVLSLGAEIGDSAGANNNAVLVSGAGSLWTNSNLLYVGLFGSSNQLTITDGGRVFSQGANIGNNASAIGNAVLVSGTGSLWTNSTNPLYVGLSGSGNQLTITNGGQVFNTIGYIGHSSSNNTVLVSGGGSVWNNASSLYVGYSASSNQLMVTDGGTVRATNAVVGFSTGVTGNQITVAGGSLIVTNATGGGAIDIRRGSLALNSGTVIVNRLYLTNNASSVMTFSAGLLRSGGSIVSNGVAFTVGDGSQSATLDLLGGDHSFANGLKLSTNGNLIGNGNIIGSATNFGVIAPGHSVGTINITGDLTLADSSWLDMELAGPGTNDVLDISGLLAAGGGLKLTLTNGYTGNAGDTFDLFNFGSISGVFSQTNLPTLAAGMEWNTGHLYTLGEIRIVPEPSTGALLALGMAAFASRRVKSSKLRVKNSENS